MDYRLVCVKFHANAAANGSKLMPKAEEDASNGEPYKKARIMKPKSQLGEIRDF